MKKIGNIASILLTVEAIFLVAILVVAIVLPNFGITPYGVLSGSMRPIINPGDIVLIDKNAVNDVREGDVIAFELATGDICTHRVNDISETGEITTKGDANHDVDAAKITTNQVIGKEIMVIPRLGDAYTLMTENRPMFLAFILSLTCLLLLLTRLKGENNE